MPDAPIAYIARTHAWYTALGYDAPYAYAHFDSVPFTPLRQPLAKSRVILLTTAAPFRAECGDQSVSSAYNASAKFYTTYTGLSAQDHDLRVSHVAVQREHLVDDGHCWFPLPALREAVKQGRLGSMADYFIGVPTNRSQRHTLEVDAPAVLTLCKEQTVDAAILVPNCPVCHQTMGLMARHLESHGIATVVMGAAKDIVEHVGVPRFLFSDFPLGSAAARPMDIASRGQMLEQALHLLESAHAPRTTWQNPLLWNGQPSWRNEYLDVSRLTAEDIAKLREANEQNREQAKALR